MTSSFSTPRDTSKGTPEQTLEKTMVDLGRSRFRRKITSAVEGNRRSTVGGGKALLRASVSVVSDLLTCRLSKGGRGRRHAALPHVRAVGAEKAAYIALRTMIDHCAGSGIAKLATIGAKIGARVEDELRFQAFKKDDRKAFLRNLGYIETSNDYRYKRRVLVHAHNQSDEAEQWPRWSEKEKVTVGVYLIDAVMEATGMFEKEVWSERRTKRVAHLTLTAEAIQMIRNRDTEQEFLEPWYLPIVKRPARWEQPWGGGYDSEEIPPLPLVKTTNRWYFESLKQTPMPRVYRAINALQETAWRVNEDVLVVLEELWAARSSAAGLPAQDPLPLPPRPEWLPDPKHSKQGDRVRLSKAEREKLTEEQTREFREWKWATRQVKTENSRLASRIVSVTKTLVVADMFRAAEAFYFPHQLDWRGRCYPVPLFLNPQGDDVARGLLTFATKRPLGEHGAKWLAIHGANCWGEDKVSFEERKQWVEEHEDQIRAVAGDPLSELWWTEADKPFQFLAFCLEWGRLLDHVEVAGRYAEFESSLPVQMDGSCNGLQHFSAMLRDCKGAEATNLMPSGKPQDIYQRVADRLVERLQRLTNAAGTYELVDGKLEARSASAERATYARQWLASKLIDRSFVKRPVMTLPYGVTKHGMKNQLREYCSKEQIDLGEYFEDRWGAINLWADELWEAIGDVVKAAVDAMGWLQDCARVANEEEMPLMWAAPSGFPVLQHYFNMRRLEVRTLLLGSMVRLRVGEETDALNRRRQVSGIAPNVVHSLDAAHLVFTVVGSNTRAARQLAWSMVHDSYGTHAGDAELVAGELREQFVRMYEDHDVLEAFRASVGHAVSAELPSTPPRGALELGRVREARYFFA